MHFKTGKVLPFEDKGRQHFCSEEPMGIWHDSQDRGPKVCSRGKILRSLMLVEFLMFRIQSSVTHREATLSILLGYL